MIKLKIISFFLSLLIVLQTLQIRQLRRSLSQNQWAEELSRDADDDICKADAPADFNHPYLPSADCTAIGSLFSDSKVFAYIHFLNKIPSNHSTEVIIPPPETI